MMVWKKTLTSLLLICYLLVSSIAAVHAFPPLINEGLSSEGLSSEGRSSEGRSSEGLSSEAVNNSQISFSATSLNFGVSEMSPNCHQQQRSDSQSTADISVNSAACKIFCAAMSNIIANDFLVDLPMPTANTEIAFTRIGFYSTNTSLEPHPPK